MSDTATPRSTTGLPRPSRIWLPATCNDPDAAPDPAPLSGLFVSVDIEVDVEVAVAEAVVVVLPEPEPDVEPDADPETEPDVPVDVFVEVAVDVAVEVWLLVEALVPDDEPLFSFEVEPQAAATVVTSKRLEMGKRRMMLRTLGRARCDTWMRGCVAEGLAREGQTIPRTVSAPESRFGIVWRETGVSVRYATSLRRLKKNKYSQGDSLQEKLFQMKWRKQFAMN